MENKSLCCCHDVTLNDVMKQIENGVTTFEELQDKTGIGTDCPPCKENNEKLFYELLKEAK